MDELTYFDKEDLPVLKASYMSIKNRANLEIVKDPSKQNEIFQKFVGVLNIHHSATLSIVNLFKMTLSSGSFYIAQCIVDFGYPVGNKLEQNLTRKYEYQLIGYALSTIDFGETLLRPETKTDKLVSRFFDKDIDFDTTSRFNDKYYLVSNKEKLVREYFNRGVLEVISKVDNLHLMTKDNEIFLLFDTDLKPQQSRAIEDIFTNMGYLDTR